jgi:hypothetical protein
MALSISKTGKVTQVSPPTKLTRKQKSQLDNAPTNKVLIKKAVSRQYNIS